LIFWAAPSGPFWRKNGGIQAFSGKFPIELTGNFFARNREFGFVEQGIQFHGTGNTISRNREYNFAEQGIQNGVCATNGAIMPIDCISSAAIGRWERADCGAAELFCAFIGSICTICISDSPSLGGKGCR
jgi:hypothetical protein